MKRALLLVLALALTGLAAGNDQKGKKEKTAPGTVVDSGSFGVFISGKRVATEKFEIVQRGDASVAKSEIRLAESGDKVAQAAELQMAPGGDLLRYAWHEVGVAKSEATVEPNAEFLVQHVTVGEKVSDVPYLLPHNTPILDDYFFSHRELLAWRYLASGCTPKEKGLECRLSRTSFGVLIPQQHTSMLVSLEMDGREKIKIRGVEHELTRLSLKGEGYDWSLWLDDQNKMVRIVIAAENTEIIRD